MHCLLFVSQVAPWAEWARRCGNEWGSVEARGVRCYGCHERCVCVRAITPLSFFELPCSLAKKWQQIHGWHLLDIVLCYRMARIAASSCGICMLQAGISIILPIATPWAHPAAVHCWYPVEPK